MEIKKKFQVPHTYVIIFGVIIFAALLTMFIPQGQYDTQEITYIQNGEEKTRTVLDPDSFRYTLDENGRRITKAAPLNPFSPSPLPSMWRPRLALGLPG